MASDGNGGVLIHTVPPVVTGISATPAGGTALGVGQTVQFAISANAAITVDRSAGTPYLALNDGGRADFQSIDSQGMLLFSTTVQAGQNVADLKALGLVANGGVLTDALGQGLDASQLTNFAGSDTGIVVDTSAPAAPIDLSLQDGTTHTTSITPTLVGRSESLSTITVYDAASNMAIGVTNTGADGRWQITTPTQPTGSHSFYAIATDRAGNMSPASSRLTIDIAADTHTNASGYFTAALANDTGSSANDGITNDDTLSGVALAGSIVTIQENAVTLGTATADAQGAWRYVPAGLADGVHVVTVSGLDTQSGPASQVLTFQFDTTAPEVTADNVLGNTLNPTLTGTATPFSTVALTLNGAVLGSTSANAQGRWNYTSPVVIAAGTQDIVATATDVAGNSAQSAAAHLVETASGGTDTSTSDLTYAKLTSTLGQNYQLQFLPGTTRVQLADGVLSFGPDTTEAFVARLYQGLLGRGQDLGGASYWDNLLIAGKTQTDVAQGFLNSVEYDAGHGTLSDGDFVGRIYAGLLGRAASADELHDLTGQLQQGVASRAGLLVMVANSNEAKAAQAANTSQIFVPDAKIETVVFTYETALGRTPDAGGLSYWISQLQSGIAPAEMMNSFTYTPEYTALHNGQSAADVVTSLYENGLGRDPTAAELNAGAGLVSQGHAGTGQLLTMLTQSSDAFSHLGKFL